MEYIDIDLTLLVNNHDNLGVSKNTLRKCINKYSYNDNGEFIEAQALARYEDVTDKTLVTDTYTPALLSVDNGEHININLYTVLNIYISRQIKSCIFNNVVYDSMVVDTDDKLVVKFKVIYENEK